MCSQLCCFQHILRLLRKKSMVGQHFLGHAGQEAQIQKEHRDKEPPARYKSIDMLPSRRVYFVKFLQCLNMVPLSRD